MAYLVLTQDEQDDMIVQTLLAQERDHFAHTLNQERYAEILKSRPADDPFAVRVQQLHDETVSRLAEVNAIVDALTPQLPDAGRIVAAVARIPK